MTMLAMTALGLITLGIATAVVGIWLMIVLPEFWEDTKEGFLLADWAWLGWFVGIIALICTTVFLLVKLDVLSGWA